MLRFVLFEFALKANRYLKDFVAPMVKILPRCEAWFFKVKIQKAIFRNYVAKFCCSDNMPLPNTALAQCLNSFSK